MRFNDSLALRSVQAIVLIARYTSVTANRRKQKKNPTVPGLTLSEGSSLTVFLMLTIFRTVQFRHYRKKAPGELAIPRRAEVPYLSNEKFELHFSTRIQVKLHLLDALLPALRQRAAKALSNVRSQAVVLQTRVARRRFWKRRGGTRSCEISQTRLFRPSSLSGVSTGSSQRLRILLDSVRRVERLSIKRLDLRAFDIYRIQVRLVHLEQIQ